MVYTYAHACVTDIGAKFNMLAIRLSKMALSITMVVDLLLALVIYLGGSRFVCIFNDDPDVQYEANKAIPVLALYILMDGLQGTAAGT